MGFNLDDYQTVAERLDEAIRLHPDIRVITHGTLRTHRW
jgi:hypothetical protein